MWGENMVLFRSKKKQETQSNIEPGDGSHLNPYRFWQIIHRSIFHIDIQNDTGTLDRYSVDVDLYGSTLLTGTARLFKNNREIMKSTIPVNFPVAHGHIDVDSTEFGLKRIHYVEGNRERQLFPDRRTPEGFRARIAHRHPRLSKALDIASITILLIGIAVLLPSLFEILINWGLFAGIDFYHSPFSLPDWVESTLFVLTILAAIERGLSIKNHWLIDMDTTYFG